MGLLRGLCVTSGACLVSGVKVQGVLSGVFELSVEGLGCIVRSARHLRTQPLCWSLEFRGRSKGLGVTATLTPTKNAILERVAIPEIQTPAPYPLHFEP